MTCTSLLLAALAFVEPFVFPPLGPHAVTTHKGLVYNPAANPDPRQTLDLYLPKGAKGFPIVLFVHGGGWKDGDKALYPPLGRMLASHGVGVAVANYRLSQPGNGVKHPDHIRDVAKAFSWLRANAGKYDGDKKRLFLMGHSAGGHLVSLLATDEAYLEAECCRTCDVRGVVSISGVYSIYSFFPVFHLPFGKNAADCTAASPMTHVKGDHPTFLVAHADRDEPGLGGLAERFSDRLREVKSPVRVMKVEDRDHVSILVNLVHRKDDPLAKAVLGFVNGK